MIKSIVFTDSATSKMKPRDITRIANKVKSKTGKIGDTGVLHGNLFYKILRNGFMIF